MPPWAVRLLSELDACDARAIAVARPLTVAQLNWTPGPGQWSIGQCLDHLQATNTVYLPPIADALNGRSEQPVNEITPGWFGRWFIRTYIAPSTTRARAPRKALPRPDVDATVLDQFLRSNADARTLVRRAAPFDVNRIRFRNPFVSVIRFTTGTGLEIVAKHEQRHLLQAERVAAAMRAAGV